ncbi:MAG TPA: iron-sulfur cluster repair protein YtfE [Polyangiaceae bacterium]|nr:iron-sulfur cluster repair protein YtfE [Polyangiaceae bacterium]
MNLPMTANDTLGQLAATYPLSTQVFLRHRLDFCCGGKQTLQDACRTRGLDPDAVIREIEGEAPVTAKLRWDSAPLTELMEFIITRYHHSLRRDLPGLIEAARRVERVHGAKPSCPRGLTALLEEVYSELSSHMDKEEQVLFPLIAAGGVGPRVHMPVRMMMMEHDDHGTNLRSLRALVTDFVPPPEACATWRALYVGLERLEGELMEHIHLENNVLFPRALAG